MSLKTRPANAFPARLLLWAQRHWLPLLLALWGIFVGLPWLAPIFMHLGWTRAGELIYLLYTPLCHQLPQRSYFLFGPKMMYSLAEIQAAWEMSYDPLVLRRFIGSPELGWKVAWSDRMVSMYGSVLLWGLIYWPLRGRLKPLRLWMFGLLLLPMAADGLSHVVNDFYGIGQGFRDSNAWLATLTNHALPASFYAGDALGSFNSWMRILTGLLFGLGATWLLFPHIEMGMRASLARERVELKRET